MDVHVLGAGQDVGRSCLLVTIGGRHLLLDCGAHHGFSDARRFPDFASIPPETLSALDGVLISHFHFDHVAALPLFQRFSKTLVPIYMTEPTLSLARLMLHDVYTTSVARDQNCPFTQADICNCLQHVRILHPNHCAPIGRNSDIFVTPYHAGHSLGAVMFYVRVASNTLLYTGDFTIRADAYLRPADVPFSLKPDMLISEATYCLSTRNQSRIEQENSLMDAVIHTLSNSGKILIPVSAFGRVHAICAIFSSYINKYPMHEIPMYVVTGLATRANRIYDEFSTAEWTLQIPKASCIRCAIDLTRAKKRRSRFSDACKHSCTTNLRPFVRHKHWDSVVLGTGPVILFATPGTLTTGVSFDVFKMWSSNPNNLVIMPGACFAHAAATNTLTPTSLLPQTAGLGHGHGNVRCKMINMSFNGHADSNDIKILCKRINPKSVLLVHGEQNKIQRFREQLQNLFKVPCFAPENGERIHIPTSMFETDRYTSEAGFKIDSLPTEWQTVLAKYSHLVKSD